MNSTLRNEEVAILGAGVGGLTTAIALHRKGFDNLCIYERSASSTVLGAGLVLWPNAIGVLKMLGLYEEIEQVSGALVKMVWYSNHNEYLGEVSITDLDRMMGHQSHPITRYDLQEVLISKVKRLGIDIRYTKNAQEIHAIDRSKAGLVFSDGEEIRPDLLIGADGRMKSVARKFVTGSNTPIYQHYVNWVGLIEGVPLDINKTKSVHDFWGIGKRFGYVPVSETKAYWAGCKKLPAGLGEPEGGNQATLLAIFENWPDPIGEVIGRTPVDRIKRIEVFDHDPIDSWHRQNVCLLGDAAHSALPTSGQGACQAIEDAWHLAACLDSSSNAGEAFASFEKLRLEKTKTITLGARAFANSLFSEDVSFCKKRNENAKKSAGFAQVKGMSSLWGAHLPEVQ